MMKFNFPPPSKTFRDVTWTLPARQVERIEVIATERELEPAAVVMTLLDAAIDEHDRPTPERAARGSRSSEVLRLHDEGLSAADIASELSIQPAYVYTILSKAGRTSRRRKDVLPLGMAFCQNAACLDRETPFRKADGVQDGGFVFCTEECKEEYRARQAEGGDK